MKIFNALFASLFAAVSLMAIYVVLIATATFIENDYGTTAAKALIYDTWFFNALHLWLLIVLLGCILRFRLVQRRQFASLLLHLSFVVIIVGAGITRFFGTEGIMHIREGESAQSFTSSENYLSLIVLDGEKKYRLSIPTSVSFASKRALDEKIIFGEKNLRITSTSITKLNDDKNDRTAKMEVAISFEGRDFPLTLIGGNDRPEDAVVDLDGGVRLIVSWGARSVELPFSIRLDEFVLERYAGSMSPSSYESKITLIEDDRESPYEIYMNHTLDHRGYRFFQSSYDQDEKGTILSVNNDPGKIPTYIGYAMLILGALWIIFAKNSRFRKLGRFLQSRNIYALLLVAFLGANLPLVAQEAANPANQNAANLESKKAAESGESHGGESAKAPKSRESGESTESSESSGAKMPIAKEEAVLTMLETLKAHSKAAAEAFGELQVQDYGGRIKPLDSLASELVHKMTKKDKFLGLTHTQVLLGMVLYANEWRSVKMLKISTPRLREIIGVAKNEKYISFNDLFAEDGEYKLTNYIEEANRTKPSQRGEFEKDLLNVDERVNIAYGIFSAQFLKILPIPGNGDMWLSPIDMMTFGSAEVAKNVQTMLQNYFNGFDKALLDGDWSAANAALEEIKAYQNRHSDLVLSDGKLKAEIFLNNTNLFSQLILPYIFAGLLMFIFVFAYIFKQNGALLKALKCLYFVVVALVILHLLALLLRWYIAGHAPWSNAYESMLYIAFTAAFAGVAFFGKSYLAVSAASFMAGISLFVANLGFMDPQISNLVPVLKSYWLNIHVSVITASYGFLGLCFLLGVVTLGLFLLRGDSPKSAKIDSTIDSISAINEMAMILGLMLLCVGNFLGGVWANESWGRYWGWDPKETWALASIGVYAIILHLRFIFKKNLQYIFASASVLGFFSVLMTYFGVNYYLSGLHSYAAGDPLPIPTFLYVMVFAVLGLVIAAFFKRKMDAVNLKN